MSFMDSIRHAFKVDEGEIELSAAQQISVDWVCIQIAKRRLATPGLVFLEMTRPLNWVGSQAMHFFRPAVWAVAGHQQEGYEGYVAFSRFLEHRGSMEYLQRRVEFFEEKFGGLRNDGEPIGPFVESHFALLRRQAAAERGDTGDGGEAGP